MKASSCTFSQRGAKIGFSKVSLRGKLLYLTIKVVKIVVHCENALLGLICKR